MGKFYFVYGVNQFGEATEKRITDEEHLQVAINTLKDELNVKKVYVNKATFCFDGFLVQGDYLGTF